ncbi:hypothetical protein EIN_344780 [Entamoeba invadens IP1]|uniref:Transmembrane protein n=1 Tax=Entamoeba invadens IP1 TaxID=370355 RepID=A0A0A1U969_ENTIV|nr:hypothetical protein EIN_344780 [Entamoeba invadens IP1]ELP88518.1 hypothetical protein EIN_344780 [Entamoeba invadens IP1]|eukprot:XP_004255289.1 hypothetical protein EIN_344780 [Entamoeba invadens IP1]
MEINKRPHQTLYEQHKTISMIVTVAIFVSVLLSFAFAFFIPVKTVQIGTISTTPQNTFKRNINITQIKPFYSFVDVYLKVNKIGTTTEKITTSSQVFSTNNKLLIEKENEFNTSCTSGYCEKVLVVSVNPLREKAINIEVSIQTESKFGVLEFIIEYKSFWYVLFTNVLHFLAMGIEVVGITFLLFKWRKTPMREWYFEHIYIIVVLFFALLFDSTYSFLYLYQSSYILWALETLQSLFLFALFLYYIILLICMSFKYIPHRGAILLAIGVGLGQFCCMVAVLLLNNIENMKNYTTFHQPIEAYVLICALSFVNVMYCGATCFFTYFILRHTMEVKQFVIHVIFTITIALIVGLTTYDYYYMTIVPVVDFNLTTSISCFVLLVGMFVITYGSYNKENNTYNQVETEIPLEDNHEVVIYDRKSLELARTIDERSEKPQKTLDPTPLQRIDEDEPMNLDDTQNPLSDTAIVL